MGLYSPRFCDLLNYPGELETARSNLVRNMSDQIPQAEQLYSKWYGQGVFFYTMNHPKLFIVEDVLRHCMLSQAGISLPAGLAAFSPDPLQTYACSPQMNHPAAQNSVTNPNHLRKRGEELVSCREFLRYCYSILDEHGNGVIHNQLSNRIFDAALADWQAPMPSKSKSTNPYHQQPSHAFWSRMVANQAVEDVTPVGQTAKLIGQTTRVATAGSCFAQHVARAMVADGLNYYIAEPAPAGMDPEAARSKTYGLFSARYGNIYSSRQLLQLVKRAYGSFTPIESAWKAEDGWIDPFRPNIGETFETPEAVELARESHLRPCSRHDRETRRFCFHDGAYGRLGRSSGRCLISGRPSGGKPRSRSAQLLLYQQWLPDRKR